MRNPLTIPRAIIGAALDLMFGKAEHFEFQGSTLPKHMDPRR